MTIDQVVSFLFQRADATLTFWNFYIGVSTAILAFVTAAKSEWLNKYICVAITFGFALFAIGNFSALNQTCNQREALIELAPELDGYNDEIKPVIESTRPPGIKALLSFHATLDITMVALIWIIVLYRRKRVQKSKR